VADNKAIVRDYLERVWGRQDYAAIDEHIRADYIQHSRQVAPGREGVKAFFRMVNDAFSEVAFDVHDLVAEGDSVVFRWTLRGRHTGPFQGMGPTGKTIAMTGISWLRLHDGQFAELWVEQDLAGMMAQLRGGG
jgi:steroid delta-isomerase-like uncharacterized protein